MKVAEKVMDGNMAIFYDCIKNGDRHRCSCTPVYLRCQDLTFNPTYRCKLIDLQIPPS